MTDSCQALLLKGLRRIRHRRCRLSVIDPIAICNPSVTHLTSILGVIRGTDGLRERQQRTPGNEVEVPDTGSHQDNDRHLWSPTRGADQRLLATQPHATRSNRIVQHHISPQIDLFEPSPLNNTRTCNTSCRVNQLTKEAPMTVRLRTQHFKVRRVHTCGRGRLVNRRERM